MASQTSTPNAEPKATSAGCYTFESSMGPIQVYYQDRALYHIQLPQPDTPQQEMHPERLESAQSDLAFEEEIEAAFQSFFTGDPQALAALPHLWVTGSEFEKTVWEALPTIPWGETTSYGRLAEQIGNSQAARAIGRALAKNPLPLKFPCHRVIQKDGGLGGFMGQGAQALNSSIKSSLLQLESQRLALN